MGISATYECQSGISLLDWLYHVSLEINCPMLYCAENYVQLKHITANAITQANIK